MPAAATGVSFFTTPIRGSRSKHWLSDSPLATPSTQVLPILSRPLAVKSAPLRAFSERWRPATVISAASVQGEAALTVGFEEGVEEETAEKGGGEAVDGGSPVESGSTKLYFGNLPYSVDSPQLAAIVQDYGVAELIEVLYDRDTGKSRGFAFVTMNSIEDCNKVIENLNGATYMGRILRVNFSDKPKPKEHLFPETEYKLFVRNLAWSVTSESLTQAFQEYGNVVGARVIYNGETGRSRGYGFVSYSTKSEMETALVALNDAVFEGRVLSVGTYFVGQYYQVLQQQPDFVHQFYSDASTMLRIDGNFRETATAMLQIHALVMSLSYTGIEIKTAHSLESWNGGVLVMVSGSVQMKNFNRVRKFVQTFFLAPQEKGYFVLNDIFHFVDEEPVHHYPAVLLSQTNLDPTLNVPAAVPETVPNYSLNGPVQVREFTAPVVKENGHMDSHKFVEQQLQQVPEPKNIIEENTTEVNSMHQNTSTVLQDHLPVSVEEHAEEPQKHTYASILRVSKGQDAPAPTIAPPYPVSKGTQPASEQNYTPPPTSQQLSSAPQNNSEREQTGGGEFPSTDDEGEIKSVYVRNLPSTVSASEVEEEFKHFGKLSSDGVVIRSRKDVGYCYAFVEFEDMTGVQNAIKAGTAQVAGRQVYIEERRANSNIPYRGGRRGRGRGSYHTESSRGHYSSRSYSMGVRDGSEPEREPKPSSIKKRRKSIGVIIARLAKQKFWFSSIIIIIISAEAHSPYFEE
ncbi:putative G3BP-like protein [Cucurbita maxima]|uniref:G3BP-like protein n=1 Tax=Cucurbita maxima TaxID=3661 RepID=A0A6J1IVW4_CUCMA|nr:putative G3BP-like protein [Cucurbita maxima]